MSPEGGSGRPVVLVVPCYNERARLPTQAFIEFVTRRPEFQVLFVNDGSTDGTADLLDGAVASRSGLEVLHLPANLGKAETVRAGIVRVLDRGCAFVGYWDADLATPLEAAVDFHDYLVKNPEHVAVIGSRVKLLGRDIDRRALRHYVGRVFATAASLSLGLAVYDTQCGAKLFRVTDEVVRAFQTPFADRWIFDVELIRRLKASWDAPAERLIYEWPLVTWRDVGESKVRLLDGLTAFLGLARVGLRRRRDDRRRALPPAEGG
jgi:glycosyltransferase involved in cell wall biosynthesis